MQPTAQVCWRCDESMYAVYHGPAGLTHIARTVHRRAPGAGDGLRKPGFAPETEAFFDTVTVNAAHGKTRHRRRPAKRNKSADRRSRLGIADR